VVRATSAALKTLRSVDQIATKRGKQVSDVLPVDRKSTTNLAGAEATS
jgi:hypothetical protein